MANLLTRSPRTPATNDYLYVIDNAGTVEGRVLLSDILSLIYPLSFSEDEDLGYNALTITNESNANNTTKKSNLIFNGVSTGDVNKQVASIEILPVDQNWTDSNIDFKIRISDIERSGFKIEGNTISIPGYTTESKSLEIGKGRSGDGSSFVDLIGDTTYSDYGTRLRRFPGSNAQTQLAHRGTGDLQLIAQDAAAIRLKTNNTDALIIDSSQNTTFSGSVQVNGRLNTDGTARIWNAVDNGVDNTGVADAGDQLNTLISSVAENDTIYLPAGTYKISTTIAIGSKALKFIGAGISSTIISVENDTGGFYAEPTDTTNPEYISFKGFSLTTDRNPLTTNAYGIHIDGSGNISSQRVEPRYLFEDIEFDVDTANTGFESGIWLSSCLNGDFTRIYGEGYWTGSSASIISDYMIRIDGASSPVDFNLTNIYCAHFDRAIYIAGTAEGVKVRGLMAIAVNYGVYWDTTAAKPQLNLSNSHINAYINCVRMIRCHQSVITGNLLYRREEATTTGDACIYMFDASNNIIHGNTFNDVNPTVGDSTAIELAGASNNNNITNNRALEDIHFGIKVNVSSLNNQVIDNDFNTVVDTPYTSSSPSTVICDNLVDKRNVYAEMAIKGLSNGTRIIDFETDTSVADRNARIAAIGGNTAIDSANLHFYGAQYIFDTGAVNIQPVTEPANPSSGFYLYVDSADGDLKVKSSSGTITTLAND